MTDAPMATYFSTHVDSLPDAGVMEAQGGARDGEGSFLENTRYGTMPGAPLPFVVHAKDPNNSAFLAASPRVYVVGAGLIEVEDADRTFDFGQDVYCVVTCERPSRGGRRAYKAKLTDKAMEGASESTSEIVACIHVARIPDRRGAWDSRGVQQYVVGTIVIPGSEESESESESDESESDESESGEVVPRVVTALVGTEVDSSGELVLTYRTRAVAAIRLAGPEETETVALAGVQQHRFVRSVVYDPQSHRMSSVYRTRKFVVFDESESSGSESVFTAQPVCGQH